MGKEWEEVSDETKVIAEAYMSILPDDKIEVMAVLGLISAALTELEVPDDIENEHHIEVRNPPDPTEPYVYARISGLSPSKVWKITVEEAKFYD